MYIGTVLCIYLHKHVRFKYAKYADINLKWLQDPESGIDFDLTNNKYVFRKKPIDIYGCTLHRLHTYRVKYI